MMEAKNARISKKSVRFLNFLNTNRLIYESLWPF